MLHTVPNVGIPGRDLSSDHVVLLDEWGSVRGTVAKRGVHHASTPLHLAFSCYVVDAAGRVLLTRRAATKRTWPSVWTNACCGHPRIDESLRQAVRRHLRTELGVAPTAMSLALGDFVYRASMVDGTTEHEWCPVVVANIDVEVDPNPDEVDDIEWTSWASLVDRARNQPETLSPWCVLQVQRLASTTACLTHVLDENDPADSLLDACPGTDRGPGPSVDHILSPVRQRVDSYLAAFLDERRGDVAEADDAMRVLQSAIAGLAHAGGKRLRPAFVDAGFQAAGGDASRSPVQAAAAVEMLHTFALIHDDVMDRSSTRRGLPSVHNRMAAELGCTDGADWFGMSAAILAGDLAFVWADQMFEELDQQFPDSNRRAARSRFDQLRTEVIAGQYLDLRMSAEPSATEADALRVALLKSARYTVTRPLQIGAVLAGAGAPLCAQLERYGDAVGLAFQLRDDILGLFGSTSVTGKPRIDDLREGKRTVLMLRALALASPQDRAVLAGALGCRTLDERHAARCRRIVADSGALASVEATIDIHLARAMHLGSTFDDGASANLMTLARYAAHRDH